MIARAINSRLGKLGLLMTGIVLILAIMGPFVAPHDPNVFMGAPFQPSNSKLLLGADVLGRDVLSRVLAGGYRTILLSLLATVMGVAGGALLGMVAGYTKGSTDEIIMRTLDVALAFPQMILALLLLSILGADAWLIVIVVAVIHLPQVARVVRAATLRVTGEDYVLHARVIGMNRRRILLSQVLPNVSGPLLVELGLREGGDMARDEAADHQVGLLRPAMMRTEVEAAAARIQRRGIVFGHSALALGAGI